MCQDCFYEIFSKFRKFEFTNGNVSMSIRYISMWTIFNQRKHYTIIQTTFPMCLIGIDHKLIICQEIAFLVHHTMTQQSRYCSFLLFQNLDEDYLSKLFCFATKRDQFLSIWPILCYLCSEYFKLNPILVKFYALIILS